jgi:hypothetical protein
MTWPGRSSSGQHVPDLLGAAARLLRCTRGQAATLLLGLLLAVATLVATVVGVENGPPDSSPTRSITQLELP